MAFEINRFVRVTSAYNAGQITTSFNPSAVPALSNGPALFTYASATDTAAQIGAANYFASMVYDLSVNDWIFATGSDASVFYQVLTVNRDAGTITLGSAFPSGVIGTANIQNDAVTTLKILDANVTTAKLADNAVTSAKLATTIRQYATVAISASDFNGMYATPKQLVAAAGANTLIVLDQLQLVMTYGSAAFAAGGTAAVQYDSTTNGAGVIASTTLANTVFQAAASTSFTMNAGVVALPFTTTVNKGLYLSNITAAFTTGDSTMVAHVWYRVIPTV